MYVLILPNKHQSINQSINLGYQQTLAELSSVCCKERVQNFEIIALYKYIIINSGAAFFICGKIWSFSITIPIFI